MTAPGGTWSLALYVNGASPASVRAIEAVRRLCDEELGGAAVLEIIDVRQQTAAAGRDQIVAVPTLVRRLPRPPRRIVGDIWDPAWLRVRLDLGTPAASSGPAGPDR